MVRAARALGWLLAAFGSGAAALARADALCQSCTLHMGFGGTYHFWGATGGTVIPLTLTFDQDRYELGVFRIATAQTMSERGSHAPHLLAEPYWGISASRRWRLAGGERWRLDFGFGASYKTEADPLNATHWNFASQLALRVRVPGHSSDLELSLRHWSNGGIRLPNRGQDFFTATFEL